MTLHPSPPPPTSSLHTLSPAACLRRLSSPNHAISLSIHRLEGNLSSVYSLTYPPTHIVQDLPLHSTLRWGPESRSAALCWGLRIMETAEPQAFQCKYWCRLKAVSDWLDVDMTDWGGLASQHGVSRSHTDTKLKWCHYLLRFLLFQTCMSFFLLWNSIQWTSVLFGSHCVPFVKQIWKDMKVSK